MKLRIGDKLEFVFKWTGIKWLVNKVVVDWLGYESCGCEDRRDALNNFKFKRDDQRTIL